MLRAELRARKTRHGCLEVTDKQTTGREAPADQLRSIAATLEHYNDRNQERDGKHIEVFVPDPVTRKIEIEVDW